MATWRNAEEVREPWGQAKAHDPFGNTCVGTSFWDSSLPHMWVFMENVFISALSVWDHFVWFTTQTGPEDREDLIFHFLSLLGYHKLNTHCSKTWIVLADSETIKADERMRFSPDHWYLLSNVYSHTFCLPPKSYEIIKSCVLIHFVFVTYFYF